MDVGHAHGHAYEEEAQSVAEGGEEEHHEKKSVLKKVKDKAKKIKDTIGKKRHGNGDEHGRGSRSSEEEEEEGYAEDNEEEKEPEVHGAPMYESETARGFVSSQEGDLGRKMLSAGRLEEDPGAPKKGPGEAVPGSYQSAPPGGPEPGVIRSFQALTVSDRPGNDKQEASLVSSGSNNGHLSPESRPTGGEEGSEISHAVEETEHRKTKEQQQQQQGDENYSEKISSATSVIVEKAVQAKDAAVSAAAGSAEYSKKIAEAVYEKVAAGGLASTLGSAVAPPLQQKQEEKEQAAGLASSAGVADKQPEKRVSMREYLADKLSPGEEDRALCDLISEAMQKRKENESDVREEVPEKKETAEAADSARTPGEKKGMVSKIKGAVTSIFGLSHGHPPQARGESMSSSRVVEQGGQKQLQESTS